jgi:protein-L-isoaspartate(D-aspartate) O-methyltransferase
MNSPSANSAYTNLRMEMVETQLRARGIQDPRVLEAMARVPRHEFMPEPYRTQAYEDHPLPIAEEQTISQPYIVAVMLEALALKASDKVLEIGTGSGYVTALLAEIAAQVLSIERHTSLALAAGQLLSAMGYQNVRVITGDGSAGFAECAPYDKIIVSAAAPQLPQALVDQLANGGRMIVPVGRDDSQQLQLIEMRDGQPHIIFRELCRFVPLVSDGSAPPGP